MELFKTVPHIHGYLFIFTNNEIYVKSKKKTLKNCQDDI